jgi:hypothetical protein
MCVLLCSHGACHRSFSIHWLEDTNLLLVIAAADCDCTTANSNVSFAGAWQEVKHILLID